MKIIEKNIPTLYAQVENDIREKIESGEYAAGSLLPSGKDLAEAYQVSIITIKKALSNLSKEGKIVSVQGKGTFVSHKEFHHFYGADAISFTERCKAQNMEAYAKAIVGEIIYNAKDSIYEQLEIEKGSPVVHIKRLRSAEENPILIEELHFPIEYAYLLAEDLNKISLYKTIREKDTNGNLELITEVGNRHIHLIDANAEQAKLLEIPVGTTIIRFSLRVVDKNTGKPVHTSGNVGYAQKYKFDFIF